MPCFTYFMSNSCNGNSICSTIHNLMLPSNIVHINLVLIVLNKVLQKIIIFISKLLQFFFSFFLGEGGGEGGGRGVELFNCILTW